MWTWILRLLPFFGQRVLHFAIYGIIGVLVWGIYQKVFIQPTNKTTYGDIARQINVYEPPREPMFGCAAWRINAELYYKKPSPKSKTSPDTKVKDGQN